MEARLALKAASKVESQLTVTAASYTGKAPHSQKSVPWYTLIYYVNAVKRVLLRTVTAASYKRKTPNSQHS
jgi:hypothetical protein